MVCVLGISQVAPHNLSVTYSTLRFYVFISIQKRDYVFKVTCQTVVSRTLALKIAVVCTDYGTHNSKYAVCE